MTYAKASRPLGLLEMRLYHWIYSVEGLTKSMGS